MAIQGRQPRRKPNGAGGILERDQDFLPTGDFVHGVDEGMFHAIMHGLHVLRRS